MRNSALSPRQLLISACTVTVIAGCAPHMGEPPTAIGPGLPILTPPALECPSPYCYDFDQSGFSGLAHISDSSQLVVHDHNILSRTSDSKHRVGILTREIINDENSRSLFRYRYDAVRIDHRTWTNPSPDPARNPTGVASDLESVCRLEGRENEFLVAESGGWPNVRRTFRIQLKGLPGPSGVTAEVKAKLNASARPPVPATTTGPTPTPRAGGKVEYEGMDCLSLDEEGEQYLVVMGERGGSDRNDKGTLHWGTYTVSKSDIVWHTDSGARTIHAPGETLAPTNVRTQWSEERWRDISGLYIDKEHRLWATAAFDADIDLFYSAVYQLGVVCKDANARPDGFNCSTATGGFPTVHIHSNFFVSKTIESYKLEGIASPIVTTDSSFGWSVASEDEDFPGRRQNGAWWPHLQP